MKKTQKMLLGMCSSAVALGAAVGISCLAVSLANKKAPEKQGDFDISFDAGEGSFVSNKNTKIRANEGVRFDTLPKPVVQQPGKIFAGWKDATSASSEILKGNQIINSNMKLVATYNNASSETRTVKFIAGLDGTTQKQEVILFGNPLVSVMNGYYYLMVNRPQATWEVSGVTKYFKGWKYAEDYTGHAKGDYIKESDAITENITLYPEFTTSATINWIVDTNHPGTIDRGSSYTTLEEGTAFDQFNQPGISCTDVSTSTSYYFEGWYKDENLTTKWNKTDKVGGDGTYTFNAYANWVEQPSPSDEYVTLSYVANDQVTTETGTQTFYPSKFAVAKKETVWGKTTKPNVKCENSDWKLVETEEEAWEYYDTATSTWKTLTSDYEFTDDISIRPKFQEAIESVSIVLENDGYVGEESSTTLTAAVVGGHTDTVTWAAYLDTGKTKPLTSDIGTLDPNTGELKIAAIDPDSTSIQTYFYVQATSTVSTSVQSALTKITIKMPYDDNQDVWFYSKESGTGHWYKMAVDDLCTGSSVTATALATSGVNPLTRAPGTACADTLHFGTDLLSIKSNFLSGWTAFNGAIDLGNSNITHIFSNFLSGCTSFNQPLDLTKIKYIGNGFLYGCTSFNQEINFTSESNANVLYEIGDDFLGNCTSFNSKITLPDTLLNINNDFLFNCTSFNQELTLPSKLQYVGSFFMSQCNNFTNTLNVNFDTSVGTTADVFACNESDLASISQSSAISATGFTVAGNQGDDFKQYYKTQQAYEYKYRRIKGSTWDGQLPDFDTLKASITKLAKTTSWTCDMLEDGANKNVLYNNEDGFKSKVTITKGTETNTYFQVEPTTKQNGLYDELDSDGVIQGLVKAEYTDGTEILESIQSVGSLLLQTGSMPEFVAVESGIGYYTVDYQGAEVHVYFDEQYNPFKTQVVVGEEVFLSYEFSNIDDTTISDLPTAKNKITMSYDTTNKLFKVEGQKIEAETTYFAFAPLTTVGEEELTKLNSKEASCKFQILNGTTPTKFMADETQALIYNVDGDDQGIDYSIADETTLFISPNEDSYPKWTNDDLLVIKFQVSTTVNSATISMPVNATSTSVELATIWRNLDFTGVTDTDTVIIKGGKAEVKVTETDSQNAFAMHESGSDYTFSFNHSWSGGCYIRPHYSFVNITDPTTGSFSGLTFNEAKQMGFIEWTDATTTGATGTVTVKADRLKNTTSYVWLDIQLDNAAPSSDLGVHNVTYTDGRTSTPEITSVYLGSATKATIGTEEPLTEIWYNYKTLEGSTTNIAQYGHTGLRFCFTVDTTETKTLVVDTANSTLTVDNVATSIDALIASGKDWFTQVEAKAGQVGYLLISTTGGNWSTISAIHLVFKEAE